jgi:hypothetical protein
MSQVQAVSCAETQQPDIRLITHSLLNNGFCNERNVEVFVISYSLASLSQFLNWIKLQFESCNCHPGYTCL